MGESEWHSDWGVKKLSIKYLCSTGYDLVQELNPLHQNGPCVSSLDCIYVGRDARASVDCRAQNPDGSGGGAEWVDRIGRYGDGMGSLSFVCIDVSTFLSGQRKLDGDSREIGLIGGIVA